MPKMIECICENPKCRCKFMARVADRKRGWARCCCKSCAATMNNKKTGNYASFILRKKVCNSRESDFKYLNVNYWQD